MPSRNSPTAATSAQAISDVRGGRTDEVVALRAELEGTREELRVARSELVQACIGESQAKAESNHMNAYVRMLHDKWASESDQRSLEEVVDAAMAKAASVEAHADAVAAEVGPLRQRVAEMEGARAYRLFTVYVRLMSRLIPVGSRRRAIYLRIVR